MTRVTAGDSVPAAYYVASPEAGQDYVGCFGTLPGLRRAELLIDGRPVALSSLTDEEIDALFPD